MQAFTLVDIGGGMLLAAIAWFCVSRWHAGVLAEHNAWVSARPQVTAIVDRLKESSDSDGSSWYTPVIVYELPDHQRYAIDGEASGLPTPPVGTRIQIAYEPTMPSTAREVSPASLSEKNSLGNVFGFAVVTFVGTLITMFIRSLF